MAITQTIEQATASDPAHSVWVTANAGTGKTKVLTDRVLRLMLSGTPIHRILCLTFTKAAAAEMSARISKQLSTWVIMPETELIETLEALTNQAPTNATINRGRRLFLDVVDNADALKIQTIHGFCQSLLKRFPLEAGVPPHFRIIEEQLARELLNEAWLRLLNNDTISQNNNNADPISHIANNVADSTLNEIIRELISKRGKILHLQAKLGSMDGVIQHTYNTLGVTQGKDVNSILHDACTIDHSHYAPLIDALLKSNNENENKRGKIIADWCASDVTDRIASFNEYKKLFLYSSGETIDEPKKTSVLTKKTGGKDPQTFEIALQEGFRLAKVMEIIKSVKVARLTESLLHVGEHIFTIYATLKNQQAYLDYDDLIQYSQQLLMNSDITPWVMYKLDGGIDHLLIDEAQDTSPEQWSIVASLCSEFFVGSGQNETDRTIFVVGDEKQSIFSFQGADIHVFETMRQFFADTVKKADQSWKPVSLALSFRSTPPILQLTDTIFNQDHTRRSITAVDSHIKHTAFRHNQPGLVEVWPLAIAEKQEESDQPWQLPTEYVNHTNSKNILAEQIASTIANWLTTKRILPAKNRPICEGDIMVLVRKRNDFVDILVRKLQQHNIAVAGIDRMTLTEHISVMDLIALGKFLLLPSDDLTLATILKSPLINLSEDALFELAYGRGKTSLWQRLNEKQDEPTYHDGAKFLQDLLNKVDFTTPFEIYTHVLEVAHKRKEFIARMGNEVNDPINEFVNLTKDYVKHHTSSLQGFIHWVESGNTIVKRDLEQGKNEIRIMTIHGSKGLQSPIVFMPDTTDTPKSKSNMLWNQDGFMLWPARAENRNTLCKTLVERQKTLEYDEYLRLLYVGLTRGEDELYVCGYKGQYEVGENTWYHLVHSAMIEIGKAIPNTDGEIMYRLESENASPNKNQKSNTTNMDTSIQAQRKITLPDFAVSPAPIENTLNNIIAPSNIDKSNTNINSPLTANIQFQRGNFIHNLLEILPNIAPDKQHNAAHKIGQHYPKNVCTGALEEVLSIINNPKFSAMFSKKSAAEVPISGLINHRMVNGQIDRLVVNENEIQIIDYKSNQSPPIDQDHIPDAYRKQMQAYYDILKQIYPNKMIRCYLLWTSTPTLMEVEISQKIGSAA